MSFFIIITHILTPLQKKNSCLKPFRKSGWTYFSLMEEIKPPAGARGTNTFSATQATPAPLLGNMTPTEEEQHEHVAGQLAGAIVSGVGQVIGLGEGSTRDNESGSVDNMDIDHPDDASGSASSKRKHAAVSVDDQTIPSSFKTTLAVHASEPPRKKSQTSFSSRNSSSATSPSVQTSSSQRRKQQNPVSSARASSKKTKKQPESEDFQTTAFYAMQSSIHHLSDMLGQTLTAPLDATTAKRDDALQVLQLQDGYLPMEDRVYLVSLWAQQPALAGVYSSLHDDELRRAWIASLLAQRPAPAAQMQAPAPAETQM
jgi:hypothetical protein